MNSYRASFVGSGSEYFRIWAVNIALTLLSASLYRPWAKVRRLQYFSRNIRLADASLDYHGEPVAILKGQLLVLAVLGIAKFIPVLAAVASLFGVLLLPWILQRSIGFRMRNTSYRGIRFGFDAPLKAFYASTGMILLGTLLLAGVFLVLPRERGVELAPAAAIALSFFFALLPVIMLLVIMSIRFKSIPFTRWGNRHFGSSLGWPAMIKMVAFIVLLAVGMGVIAIVLAYLMTAFIRNGLSSSLLWLVVLGAISLMTGFKAIVAARLHNISWNDTQLGQDRFRSDLSEWRFALASIGVFWLTLLTLGLYRPFGLVRLAKMQVESLEMQAVQSIDDTTAEASDLTVSAFGQEAADWFDIDIAF